MAVSHRVSVRYAVKTHLQAALQQSHVREQLSFSSIKPQSVSLSRKVRVKVTEHKPSLVNSKSVGRNIRNGDSSGVIAWREHIPAVDAVTLNHLQVSVTQKQVGKLYIAGINKIPDIQFSVHTANICKSIRLRESLCLHKHTSKREVNVRPCLSHAHIKAVIPYTYIPHLWQKFFKQTVAV